MDNVNKNISILEYILRYCGDITQLVERFGDSIDIFKTDTAFRHACSMCIIQIGELSARLTDDFKHVYDGIPWKNVKAIRNRFAHNYEGMSVEKTWNTIKQDIPLLSCYCSDILNQYHVLDQLAFEIDNEQEDEDALEP
jgi:uncharacterized protein with HEPN domain